MAKLLGPCRTIRPVGAIGAGVPGPGEGDDRPVCPVVSGRITATVGVVQISTGKVNAAGTGFTSLFKNTGR